jgi:hypothetical protein
MSGFPIRAEYEDQVRRGIDRRCRESEGCAPRAAVRNEAIEEFAEHRSFCGSGLGEDALHLDVTAALAERFVLLEGLRRKPIREIGMPLSELIGNVLEKASIVVGFSFRRYGVAQFRVAFTRHSFGFAAAQETGEAAVGEKIIVEQLLFPADRATLTLLK